MIDNELAFLIAVAAVLLGPTLIISNLFSFCN